MPRYFFVVRHGDETSCNSDGIEFPDMDAVQLEATKSTGDILRDLTNRLKLVRNGEWKFWTTPASLFSVFVLSPSFTSKAASVGWRVRLQPPPSPMLVLP
jgi:hypothetical protein